ncbi:T9SS type A sorting domain-containing protein [uncultured Kordia sp.]|uniref:T9SS type A sorting domain-containing protein n=1 Tax=uncultured Kordia sp. TaxID=507699 RepID=UPI00261B435D|nr:T9SS type A sorting domain-containing protein [uncultured Kordia sp.]
MTKNYLLLIALLISSLSFGQIVTNGDFESWTGGVLDTWTSETGTTVEQETTIVNGGANAAKFTVTTQSQGSTDFRQTVNVEAGKTYDVSVWVYQADNAARARLFVDGYQGYSDPDNLNAWQEVTYEYSATATGTIDIGLRFYDISSNWAAAGNMSVIYIDDYSVTEQVTTVPSVTITAPTASSFAPGTTSVDVEYVTQNVNLVMPGSFVNVTVNMNPTDTDVSSPYTIPTMNGGMYDVTVELYDNNMLVDTKMISFSIGSETQVASITELRAGTVGDYYELTGEAIISYIVTDGTRNQKYIQDGAAGILIDDTAGTLSAPLNIGDGIIGLKGQLSQFSGVLQFVPSENVPGASSTGNTVSPIDVTVTELATNGETYESRLIRLIDGTFDAGDVGTMFTDNTNYTITTVGGTDTTVCRVAFGDEDLIGTTIPGTHVNIIGLGGEFNGTYQVFPRYASDIEDALSTEEFGTTTTFSMYPNPANGTTVTIASATNSTKEVKVYSIIGKQVINTKITNTLNIADLQSGIYVVQITENGKSATKKLVIK